MGSGTVKLLNCLRRTSPKKRKAPVLRYQNAKLLFPRQDPGTRERYIAVLNVCLHWPGAWIQGHIIVYMQECANVDKRDLMGHGPLQKETHMSVAV